MPERHVQFYEFKRPDCVGDQCVLHQCACIASRLGEKKSHDSTCTAVVTESIYSAYCCVRCLLNAYNLQNQSVCTPFLSTRQLARPHNRTHSLYTVEWSSLISSLSFREAYSFLTEGKPIAFLQKGSLQLSYRREAYSFLTEGKPTAFLQKGSLQLSYRREAYNFLTEGKPTAFLQKGSLQLSYRREAYSFLTEGKPTAFLQKGSLQLSYRREAYNFLTEGKLTTFLQRPSFPSSKKPTTFFNRVWAAQVLGSLQLYFLFL